MRFLKEKLIAATGAISTLLGGAGAVLAGIGICPCLAGPMLSVLGILTMSGVFLSKHKFIFLVIGLVFLLTSFFFYQHKKSCKIHKKV